MADQVPFVSDSEGDAGGVGALPFGGARSVQRVSDVISGDDIRRQISAICEAVGPNKLDPTGEVGIQEVEISLVVSAGVGVQLLGEVKGGAEASLKVKIVRQK